MIPSGREIGFFRVLRDEWNILLPFCDVPMLVKLASTHRKLGAWLKVKFPGPFSLPRLLHHVFDLHENILLTGPAGSGKSFLLEKLLGVAQSRGVHVAMTALTAFAATNLPQCTTL